MSTDPLAGADEALREHIISKPDVVLDDPRVIEALLKAEDAERGANVVDMRGLAIARLENRLDRLEQTHQSVLTAAYDNVATTAQVHRALLTMISPLDFDEFLAMLDTHVADTLRLRAIRLALESDEPSPDSDLNPVSGTLTLLPAGFLEGYVTQGRRTRHQPVILRGVSQGNKSVYGTAAADIRSEAVVRLNLGPGRAPGLLVLGASDPEHFQPGQATDLLELFARVCERLVRGWLT